MSPITLEIASEVTGLHLGVVQVRGLVVAPSPAHFTEFCATRAATVRQHGVSGGDEWREAVRAMVRAGGFTPAGRNKPAQEYLLRTVLDSGSLPAILNAVDAINVISLESGLPISLLATARLGSRAIVRYGQPGERFVFNRSAQELDLQGLICVCSADSPNMEPLGTPIKDSMLGKVTETDRDVVAILYAPAPAMSVNAERLDWPARLDLPPAGPGCRDHPRNRPRALSAGPH
jgi:DNA/RNA-binding domain of Phe-tRNA-synthetase-like protein